MASVLIIDSYLFSRFGLKHIITQEHRNIVFGEASNEAEAIALLDKQRWDVVCLDIPLVAQNGIAVLRAIHSRQPAARIIVLGAGKSFLRAAQSVLTGSGECIARNASRADFLKVFNSAIKRTPLPCDVPPSPLLHSQPAPLSPRESRVALGIVAGRRPVDIAAELRISTKSVATYRRRALDKLRLSSNADLVRFVLEHGPSVLL